MKCKHQQLVAAAVLISAVAAAGCSADALSSANKTITQVTGASKTLGSARMPTAAIAAAVGGMEMVKALSLDGQAAKKSGGIIAAGGGNIIAAGSLNFALLQSTVSGVEGKQSKKLTDNNVNADVEYESKLSSDKLTMTSTITSFKGKSNGYDINATGSFVYSLATGSPRVQCEMKGSLQHLDKDKKPLLSISLEKLFFNAPDPLPNSGDIGGFLMVGKDGDSEIKLDATLSVLNGKINAESKVFINGKEQAKKAKINQDNPNFGGLEGEAEEKK